MSDLDDSHSIALGVALAAVALVLAGVLALAMTRPQHGRGAVVAEAEAEAEAPWPVERIFFEAGSATLAPDASEALGRAADAVRADGSLSLLVLPFHASTLGTPAVALADERASAVGHALQANGVAPRRIIQARPEPAGANEPARDAERVEIRLQ